MSNTEAPAGTGSLEAVKLVKTTETEWESKIAAARKAAEAALAKLRDEARASVAAARAEAESARTRSVETVRETADADAEKIVAEGQAAAQRDPSSRPLADQKDAILSAVLEDLAGQ
jgi:vacuolar-type H+-ATPase subunit H